MHCSLYRSHSVAVICRLTFTALFICATFTSTHAAPKPRELPKGPRAIALVQITKVGKAQLVPIAIFDRGKWYDAQAYQASPVPLAAQWDTVYEATELGQSVGLFTITQPQQYGGHWVARGNWKPGAGDDSYGGKKPTLNTAPAKPKADPEDERPILHKPGSKPAAQTPPITPAPTDTKPPAKPSVATDASDASDDRPVLHKNREDAKDAPSRAYAAPDDDPDRPKLRHGKPLSKAGESDLPTETELATAASTGGLTVYAAFSAAHNPELRSYKFYFQPGEEEAYRKKMLALARTEVLNRARTLGLLPHVSTSKSAAPARSTSARKLPKPPAPTDDVIFDSVNLRSFDLSYSNEPEFVLAVKAHIVRSASVISNSATPALTYDVTLAARADLNGDLRRLLLVATDERHLDELPRLELIDAIDADGDGTGDLLFRETTGSDPTSGLANTGYVIYQTGRDQLWQLFRTAR